MRGWLRERFKWTGSVYQTNTTHKIGIAYVLVKGRRKYVIVWDTGAMSRGPFKSKERAEAALRKSAQNRAFPWKLVEQH